MSVGQRIREYLISIGKSQVWLSGKTGIAPPKLNLVLTGKRRMTFDEYELICGALEVNTDKFIKPRVLDAEVV